MESRFELFNHLINKIAKSIRKIKTEEMSGFGIKSSHVVCIYYLYHKTGLTAVQLGYYCDEDKALISRSISFLEREGYVEFECGEQKTYNKKIVLTQKGKALGEVISSKIDNVLDSVGSFMSEDERAVFYKTLSRISNELDDITDKYGEK